MATFELRSALSHHDARGRGSTRLRRTGHVPLTREGLESAFFVFEVDWDDLVSQSEFLTVCRKPHAVDTLSDNEVNSSFQRAVDPSKETSRSPTSKRTASSSTPTAYLASTTFEMPSRVRQGQRQPQL